MRILNRLFKRLLNFTTSRRGDERLPEEMESHISAQTEENIRAGMIPGEARRNARMKFGTVAAIREEYHDEEVLPGVFATRLLGQIVYQANPRDPLVVGGGVLTMALLGIAASAIPAGRALAVDPSKLMREE